MVLDSILFNCMCIFVGIYMISWIAKRSGCFQIKCISIKQISELACHILQICACAHTHVHVYTTTIHTYTEKGQEHGQAEKCTEFREPEHLAQVLAPWLSSWGSLVVWFACSVRDGSLSTPFTPEFLVLTQQMNGSFPYICFLAVWPWANHSTSLFLSFCHQNKYHNYTHS